MPRVERLRVTDLRMMTKPGKAAKWAARSERLKATLRENLKRRKAQARGRAAASAAEHGSATAEPMQASKVPDFRRNRGSE